RIGDRERLEELTVSHVEQAAVANGKCGPRCIVEDGESDQGGKGAATDLLGRIPGQVARLYVLYPLRLQGEEILLEVLCAHFPRCVCPRQQLRPESCECAGGGAVSHSELAAARAPRHGVFVFRAR